jgi:hypothetical protein
LGEKLLKISENIKCRDLGVNIALSKIGLITLFGLVFFFLFYTDFIILFGVFGFVLSSKPLLFYIIVIGAVRGLEKNKKTKKKTLRDNKKKVLKELNKVVFFASFFYLLV